MKTKCINIVLKIVIKYPSSVSKQLDKHVIRNTLDICSGRCDCTMWYYMIMKISTIKRNTDKQDICIKQELIRANKM